MRIPIVSLMLLFLLASCTSTEQDYDPESTFENLVSIEAPQPNQQKEKSQLYLDSAEKFRHQNKTVILIRGSFPDGCTRLESARHSVVNDSLKINLHAWRNPSLMCSQALTSFSYIYTDIPETLLNKFDLVTVNDKTYKLN